MKDKTGWVTYLRSLFWAQHGTTSAVFSGRAHPASQHEWTNWRRWLANKHRLADPNTRTPWHLTTPPHANHCSSEQIFKNIGGALLHGRHRPTNLRLRCYYWCEYSGVLNVRWFPSGRGERRSRRSDPCINSQNPCCSAMHFFERSEQLIDCRCPFVAICTFQGGWCASREAYARFRRVQGENAEASSFKA